MKKKNIYAIVIGMVCVILLSLGLTYSYWILNKWQEKENVVNTACLDVVIESEQDEINLLKAYPISDEDGSELEPFKFTIRNKCDDIAKYQINLESMSKNGETEILEGQRLNPKYLKYKINEIERNGKVGLLTGEKDNDTTKVDKTLTNAYEAHSLTTGYLKPGTSKNFEFRLWMDGDVTADDIDAMNKILVSKITVTSTYATTVVESLEDTILGLDLETIDSGETGLYKVDHTGANIEFTTDIRKIKEFQKSEYRFAGVDPNNYISFGETYPNDIYTFNDTQFGGTFGEYNSLEECQNDNKYYEGSCEKIHNAGDFLYWRVIGLVNTVEGQRVKIIKNDSIGEYSWDSTPIEVNDGEGINEWSKSAIMKLLNPNFESEDVNNSLYWNGTSGECYVGSNMQKDSCDFTGKGVPGELKSMIEEVTWNIGANSSLAEKTKDDNSYLDIPTTKMYEYERSKNDGKQFCMNQAEEIYCNDKEIRTYTWSGKVGLISPSDYGYATSGGSEDTRSKCLNQNLYFWTNYNSSNFPDETDHPDCYSNDWLLPISVYWTITPASLSKDADCVFDIRNVGDVADGGSIDAFDIRPSVYIKSNVMVVSGNGSKADPWILSIES